MEKISYKYKDKFRGFDLFRIFDYNRIKGGNIQWITIKKC